MSMSLKYIVFIAFLITLGYFILYSIKNLKLHNSSGRKVAKPPPNANCKFILEQPPPTFDIEMGVLYDRLKFDNLYGGVREQGWDIKYNENQWSEKKKLKVFVVPYSHNDPGWLLTFEEYYYNNTHSILDNMVNKLLEDNRRKFIWAEISFFSQWWEDISADMRAKVKLLLYRGQLEIVTGGWVMADEANSHCYSIIQELLNGHQWLLNNLNYRPRYSWSIDPFGLSPTMPALLKKMAFDGLVFHRAHYSVKKYLAKNNQLEFRWRQLWDSSGKTDLMSHMMPFLGYDVLHTCGPDPKICCQFDFKRLLGYGLFCPFGPQPLTIDACNVAHKAALLVDQYKKKAQLFKTDVLLVQLGDDGRFIQPSEWDVQYVNYQKLFDHINNSSLNVEAQFGTLRDYFDALKLEMPYNKFPTLSGDFFTYADQGDHYWSGYYTSRPFYKRLDRVLIAYMRSAEILLSLSWNEALLNGVKPDWLVGQDSVIIEQLSDARSTLSLFQHHDAITGTARERVVDDFATKLVDAINNSYHVMQQAVHFLLSPSKEMYTPDPFAEYFNLDEIRKLPASLPKQSLLRFSHDINSIRVVIFNSLTWKRTEVVSLCVATANVQVKDSGGNVIQSQLSPSFQICNITKQCFLLTFVAIVEPLGLTTYFVEETLTGNQTANKVKIRIFNNDTGNAQNDMFENWVKEFDNNKEFSIQNNRVFLVFNTNGLLKSITLKDIGVTIPLQVSFSSYTSRIGFYNSGAYLFLPDGKAKIIDVVSPLTFVLDGPIMSKVVVQLPNVQHMVIVYNTPGADGLGLEIQNYVDISTVNSDYELSMQISSNINNEDIFYTDLNGFQVIRRKRYSKLPLQANFYPMPSLSYIEDKKYRLSVLSGQPLGVASLKDGQIEVIQDRKLFVDDSRGLGEAIKDNKPVLNVFRLLIEMRKPNCSDYASECPGGIISEDSHLALNSLLYPMNRHVSTSDARSTGLQTSYHSVKETPGVDIHLVTLTTLTINATVSIGVIVHRSRLHYCFPSHLLHHRQSDGMLNVSSLIPSRPGEKMYRSSLTFTEVDEVPVEKSDLQLISAMDIAAFQLQTYPL